MGCSQRDCQCQGLSPDFLVGADRRSTQALHIEAWALLRAGCTIDATLMSMSRTSSIPSAYESLRRRAETMCTLRRCKSTPTGGVMFASFGGLSSGPHGNSYSASSDSKLTDLAVASVPASFWAIVVSSSAILASIRHWSCGDPGCKSSLLAFGALLHHMLFR